MNNAPSIKAGDFVEVVVKGRIDKIDSDGEVYLATSGPARARFYPESPAVTSIEVIKPPLSVGDRGQLVQLNAPDGALLQSTADDDFVLFKSSGKYVASSSTSRQFARDFNDHYEVVYLPAAAASSTCEGGC